MDYRAMLADFRGEQTAEITTAQPLSDEQTQRLRDMLAQELRSDVQIEATTERQVGGRRTLVGFRTLRATQGYSMVMAEPRLAGDTPMPVSAPKADSRMMSFE